MVEIISQREKFPKKKGQGEPENGFKELAEELGDHSVVDEKGRVGGGSAEKSEEVADVIELSGEKAEKSPEATAEQTTKKQEKTISEFNLLQLKNKISNAESTEEDVLAALDELVVRGIFTKEGDIYCFTIDSPRDRYGYARQVSKSAGTRGFSIGFNFDHFESSINEEEDIDSHLNVPSRTKGEKKQEVQPAQEKTEARTENLSEAEKNLIAEETIIRQIEAEINAIEAMFENSNIDAELAKQIYELTDEETLPQASEEVTLIHKIEGLRKELAEHQEKYNRFNLEVTLNKLNLERQQHNLTAPELAADVLNKESKSAKILTLMPELPEDMTIRLKELVDKGTITVKDGKISVTKDFYDEKAIKEAAVFISDLEDYIKRDVAEGFFAPSETPLDFEKVRKGINLTELVNMVGEERDIDRILVLLKEGKLRLVDGNLEATDGVGEKLYNHLVDELTERAKSEVAEEVKKELEVRAKNDPFMKEIVSVLDEKATRLEELNEKFGFEKRKGFLSRILSKVFKSKNYADYLKHKEEMRDLETEVKALEVDIQNYEEQKLIMIEFLAAAQVETYKGITNFDSLNFDIDRLADALGAAKAGVEFQTYKTPLAKGLIEEYDLREGMRERGLKKPPKVAEITSVDALKEVTDERKKYIGEKVKGDLEERFDVILDDFEINDESKREEFKRKIFNNKNLYDKYVKLHVEQEGTAVFMQKKMEGNYETEFMSRFMAENLSHIHNLEIDKDDALNEIIMTLESDIVMVRADDRIKDRRRYMKGLFSGVIGGKNIDEIEEDTALSDIIKEGDGFAANVIKRAVADSTRMSGAPAKISEIYYSMSENTNNWILSHVPDAEGPMQRYESAKAKKAEAQKKLKAKEEVRKSWLEALFG